MTKILVTGADGFIGKNLCIRFSERNYCVLQFNRSHSSSVLPVMLNGVDIVIHLAGVNRPLSDDEFTTGNADLTTTLCNAIAVQPHKPILVFASSTQAIHSNAYGKSKLTAENAVRALAIQHEVKTHIYRLPNVFGKWCKPNYNSVVATFCHNISQDLPIHINDASKVLDLVYIDDVVNAFLKVIADDDRRVDQTVAPQYSATLGELATLIKSFKESRITGVVEPVGTGFTRALYSTYVSYLSPQQFAYPLTKHADSRGEFVEMLKTQNSGQLSYFTAFPGVTRGGHYHHTKTEKFLVIRGHAKFGFRHIITNEQYEINTNGGVPQVVETVPGWTHDITNIGNDELIVMLWANEIFNRDLPDTIANNVR